MMRRSFTIIELLLVIGIIGTLSGIVIGAINPSAQLASAQNAKRRAAAREMGQAITQYEIDYGEVANIPTGSANALPVCRQDVNGLSSCVDIGFIAPNYLIAVPQDSTETEPAYSGYEIYRDGPQVIVRSQHIGESGGNVDLVTDGLVSWWTFDDMSGTTATDIASYNEGTLISMDPGTDWVTDVPQLSFTNSGSLQFASASQYVRVSHDDSLSLTDTLTISLWMKPEADYTGFAVHPFRKWTGTADANYVLYYPGTGWSGNNRKIVFYANRGGSWGTISYNQYVIDLNEWTHVALVYSAAAGGQLYINGEPTGGLWGGGTLATNTANLEIGRYEGLLDDVRLYSRTLSAAEIARIASGNG